MLNDRKFILLRPSYAPFAQARMGARFRTSGYPVVALLCHQPSKHSILLLTFMPWPFLTVAHEKDVYMQTKMLQLENGQVHPKTNLSLQKVPYPHVSIGARLLSIETASIGVDTTADTESPKLLVARKPASRSCVSG